MVVRINKNEQAPAVKPTGGNRSVQGSLIDQLTYSLSKDMYSVTPRDKFTVVTLSVRAELAKRWIATQQHYYYVDAKRLYFLSLEFLLGRLLRNYLINLDALADYRDAVEVLAASLEEVEEHEGDAALGNGGLGRLAACFLDSMATLKYPCYGYGIRYEYGIFSQKIKDGYQTEAPDNWLRYGNPWEFPRPELLYPVRFYGRVLQHGHNGRSRSEWLDTDEIMAMAYDYPVPGFHNAIVNTLRLWAAKSTREFDFEYFNNGDYVKAVEDKNSSENISKVLYPNDYSTAGKELRLKQQYFFVAATLADVVRRYKKFHQGYRNFPEKVAIQLNDTHPSIAVPELMRILVDEEGFEWSDAWDLTTATFGYTNHTILPEALERWPEEMIGRLLPRHLQIIREIDRRLLIHVSRRFPDEPERKERTGLITGGFVNMARMAIVGSHTTNGVSKLHSDILKNCVFNDFYLMYPERFRNVTNGITQRRWLLEANPSLSALISESIGSGWTTDLEELRGLEKFADEPGFCKRFDEIKRENKKRLANILEKTENVRFEPGFLLDCQVKRFHEYKRQLLNVFHVITLYNRIREGRIDNDSFTPRTVLFSGKSAPGYQLCKLIIKFIHNVADMVAAHPLVRNKLQVLFVPNYGVTLAEQIIPAAELSEQISTAGYEASGTGNMKFMLNGALTIGTLDGANVEMREEVGEENFFLFGMNADEILDRCVCHNPRAYIEENDELAKIISQMSEGFFSPEDPNLFRPIVDTLLGGDRYFVLADYASFIACQERVSRLYHDRQLWTRMAIMNVARSGKFSSDRSIREYAKNIWHMSPVSL
ncbi:MAG: Maltodextrin phosphorylase [Syntrophorhabdaceae bacterium PtaU1.Bin034]|nr:MAG: Maltodextrin phosphorylase [Syntrophorhabdaceae bacterium PtaU1.Bin034]